MKLNKANERDDNSRFGVPLRVKFIGQRVLTTIHCKASIYSMKTTLRSSTVQKSKHNFN